eukprot:GHVP01057984.1.p1 GENE.GHVP01057984.1~~GHVP01057984.1.p1  ORF type:complete len:623 (-),score=103.75 GHVP01057984.1:1235-3103(-)
MKLLTNPKNPKVIAEWLRFSCFGPEEDHKCILSSLCFGDIIKPIINSHRTFLHDYINKNRTVKEFSLWTDNPSKLKDTTKYVDPNTLKKVVMKNLRDGNFSFSVAHGMMGVKDGTPEIKPRNPCQGFSEIVLGLPINKEFKQIVVSFDTLLSNTLPESCIVQLRDLRYLRAKKEGHQSDDFEMEHNKAEYSDAAPLYGEVVEPKEFRFWKNVSNFLTSYQAAPVHNLLSTEDVREALQDFCSRFATIDERVITQFKNKTFMGMKDYTMIEFASKGVKDNLFLVFGKDSALGIFSYRICLRKGPNSGQDLPEWIWVKSNSDLPSSSPPISNNRSHGDEAVIDFLESIALWQDERTTDILSKFVSSNFLNQDLKSILFQPESSLSSFVVDDPSCDLVVDGLPITKNTFDGNVNSEYVSYCSEDKTQVVVFVRRPDRELVVASFKAADGKQTNARICFVDSQESKPLFSRLGGAKLQPLDISFPDVTKVTTRTEKSQTTTTESEKSGTENPKISKEKSFQLDSSLLEGLSSKTEFVGKCLAGTIQPKKSKQTNKPKSQDPNDPKEKRNEEILKRLGGVSVFLSMAIAAYFLSGPNSAPAKSLSSKSLASKSSSSKSSSSKSKKKK